MIELLPVTFLSAADFAAQVPELAANPIVYELACHAPPNEAAAKHQLLASFGSHLAQPVPHWDALADALWDLAPGVHIFVLPNGESLMRSVPYTLASLFELMQAARVDDERVIALVVTW